MLKEYCAICEERIKRVDKDVQRTIISRGGKFRQCDGMTIDTEQKLVDDIICDSCWTKVCNCLSTIRDKAGVNK